MGHAYYNEYDAGAAAWLRELIKAGHIAPGEVDERSIADVDAADLRGFTQCHFFAGIGGWSHALRLAGWPDDKPVWTGSPPCQPFSAAGKRLGKDDERHLAPVWLDLVLQCRPPILFGEQVADAIRVGWLDDLQDRLEAGGYACGSAVLAAASFGAPHIRKRLYFGAVGVGNSHDPRLEGQRGGHQAARGWDGAVRSATEAGEPDRMAHSDSIGRLGRRSGETGAESGAQQRPDGLCDAGGMADTVRLERRDGHDIDARRHRKDFVGTSCPQSSGGMADMPGCGRGEKRPDVGGHLVGDREEGRATGHGAGGGDMRTGAHDGFWGSADWLHCRDGKWRPVEPGTQPLAHGVSGRVGLLRGYGNAIVPQVAQAFIEEFRNAAGAMN